MVGGVGRGIGILPVMAVKSNSTAMLLAKAALLAGIIPFCGE
jgi:hypothetical protein